MHRLGGCMVLALAAVAPLAAIEISTGFLIGASYDPRAFYVRPGPDQPWRKTNTSPEYRKTAHGKLVGVLLGEAEGLTEAATAGVSLVTLPLQTREANTFDGRGVLRARALPELRRKLMAADEAGLIVELVLFHPARDEEFHSPEAIVDAARNLTDWLIEHEHRNVLLNFAGDWTAPGWDFGNWIPLHFEQLAETVRERFQHKRAGYTAPIALSVPVRLREDAPLIGAADLLLVSGEALELDLRKIDRPAVTSDPGACAQAFARLAGCTMSTPEQVGLLTPLLFAKPPRAR